MEWKGELWEILVLYYSKLFKSSNPSNIQETYEVVKDKPSGDQKVWCIGEFTEKEIDDALFQMHPLKALGSDGLPTYFFQKYWHVVGKR